MKIYLAADYARKDEMQGVRDVLEALGHEVTARWIDNPDSVESMGIGGKSITDYNLKEGIGYSINDMQDLHIADTVIHFTTGEPSRGGRHTEFGAALALRKTVAIVGPRENVFQCDQAIMHYRSWSEFVIEFSEQSADQVRAERISGMAIVHFREDIYDTHAVCGQATTDDEWTTNPKLVTCLACELNARLDD